MWTSDNAVKMHLPIAAVAALLLGGYMLPVHAEEINSPRDLIGKRVGAVTGSTIQSRTEKYQPGLKYLSFNDYVSGVEALRRGKIEAMPMEKMMADVWMARCPGEFRLSEVYIANDMGYFFKKGSPLVPKVSAILTEMHRSGEIDRLYRKWCNGGHPETNRLEKWTRPGFTGKNGKLRFAMDGEHEPCAFTTPNGFIGLDIDIVGKIAVELDMQLELVQVNISGLIISVQTGKTDFGGGQVSITAERCKLVDFSVPTIHGGYVLLLPTGKKSARESSLKASFDRTFVEEGRWKLLLRGFGVTLAITALAALFGTLLSFVVWLLVDSRLRILSAIGRSYVAVLQGTPALVVLMVMYYIVFGNVDINGIWVAVLVFSMNLSAYGGMLLKTSIATVGIGQSEAAFMLGFSRAQTFFRVILPQAMKVFMPVYRGQLIELLKGTAVVGYIAIQDITKMGDIIRSRTYESFFPLIVVAVVYFLSTQALVVLLKAVERKMGVSK